MKSAATGQLAYYQQQFGFRNQHSTIQQVVRITENINDKLYISTSTAAVFLDVEEVFDRLGHNGLI